MKTNPLIIIARLTRIPLSLAVASTALAGSAMQSKAVGNPELSAFIGVLALSSGASALNQLVERKEDSLMSRTMGRPLPARMITMGAAAAIAAALIAAGLGALFFFASFESAAIGVFGLVSYWAYTLLKKRTRYAVFAGAVAGSLPPLMGWAGAGGFILHPSILVLSLFMFLWQVPHFLLLTMVFGSEYARAGFPTIGEKYGNGIVRIFIITSIILTSVCTLFFPVFDIVRGALYFFGLLLFDCCIILAVFMLLFWKASFGFRSAVSVIYAYQGLVLILVVLSALFPAGWFMSM